MLVPEGIKECSPALRIIRPGSIVRGSFLWALARTCKLSVAQFVSMASWSVFNASLCAQISGRSVFSGSLLESRTAVFSGTHRLD